MYVYNQTEFLSRDFLGDFMRDKKMCRVDVGCCCLIIKLENCYDYDILFLWAVFLFLH